MSVEVRNKVAELEGWTWKARTGQWVKGSMVTTLHPIRDDLDACAAAWDRHAGAHGWIWTVGCAEWLAYRHIDEDDAECAVWTSGDDKPDAASELRDRWALLGEVLKARGVWK